MLAPIVPPAPGRFSTTMVRPSCLPTWSMTTRVITSVALPAPSGTITVMLRDGQSCADAGAASAINVAITNSTQATARIDRSVLIVSSSDANHSVGLSSRISAGAGHTRYRPSLCGGALRPQDVSVAWLSHDSAIIAEKRCARLRPNTAAETTDGRLECLHREDDRLVSRRRRRDHRDLDPVRGRYRPVHADLRRHRRLHAGERAGAAALGVHDLRHRRADDRRGVPAVAAVRDH